jgi:hypothetical protein
VVYSKRLFGEPAKVLRYLARCSHRAANPRLVPVNDKGVTFKWKDYRLESRERYGMMTLDTHESTFWVRGHRSDRRRGITDADRRPAAEQNRDH